MKTIVLPGYSTKNKEWAEVTAKELPDAEAIEWEHWSNPGVRFNSINEAEKILGKIGDNRANIVAKSIGTLVLVKLLEKSKGKVGKIILCGVPTNDMDENDLSFYKILSDIDANQILVFQNSLDEHGNFEQVRRFLSEINPNIKIVEKPGSTHNYPFYEEFREFLG